VTANLERQAALLAWYFAHARAMPWRSLEGQVDPYCVVVSELMLQQTRVDTVKDYFVRWLARWPDWPTLAAADLDEVLAQWTGLGYYNRARNLHRLAQVVVADLGGRLPADADRLRALPGIGPYTAGAVASIAFGQPVALVDGNVARVLSRWSLVHEEARVGAGSKAVWALAQAALAAPGPARSTPGHWNQALMELGAMVCTPRAAGCGHCPVAAWCEAKAAGLQNEIPAVRVRPQIVAVAAWHAIVCDGRGQVLLGRRPDRGRWAGLWEPPGAEGPGAADAVVGWARRHGIALDSPLAPVIHVLTHRRYTATPLPGRSATQSVEVGSLGYTASRWATVGEVRAPTAGLSRLGQRLVAAVHGD